MYELNPSTLAGMGGCEHEERREKLELSFTSVIIWHTLIIVWAGGTLGVCTVMVIAGSIAVIIGLLL